jgi:hypothetical protein
MIRVRRLRFCLLTAALSVFTLISGCAREAPAAGADISPDEVEIYIFYDGMCSACDKLGEFYDILALELDGAEELYPYKVIPYNAFNTTGAKAQEDIFQKLGIDKDGLPSLPPPLLVINGEVFQGEDAIRQNVREAFISAGEKLK